MPQNVQKFKMPPYDRQATIITVLLFVLFIGGAVWFIVSRPEDWQLGATIFIAGLLFISFQGLWFAPLRIEVSPSTLYIFSSFRCRRIPLSHIVSATVASPPKNSIRTWASGGFMGYWGSFYSPDGGKYRAFFTNPSLTVKVTLKSGLTYYLGASNPAALAAALTPSSSSTL